MAFKTLQILLLILLIEAPCCFTEVYQAKVIQVSEGDILKVKRGKRSIRIKLYGIDSPELKQPYGNTAKKYTSKLCLNKMVKVKVLSKDKFGRTVAEVVVDNGTSLNQEMVKHGFAWYYQGGGVDETMAKLEKEAKSDLRGLWQDPEAIAPWRFREKSRTYIKKVELKGVFQAIDKPIIVSVPINADMTEFKHLAVKLTIMYGFVEGEFGSKSELMNLLKKEQFLETSKKFVPFVEDQVNKIIISYSYKELQEQEHRIGFTERLAKKLNGILKNYGLQPRVKEILIKSFVFTN